MDLNMAFAKHWDKKNPSDFVRACDESRKIREDYEYYTRKKRELVVPESKEPNKEGEKAQISFVK
jgi:hypothetical protein